jgi:anti-sigma-K factor RskA
MSRLEPVLLAATVAPIAVVVAICSESSDMLNGPKKKLVYNSKRKENKERKISSRRDASRARAAATASVAAVALMLPLPLLSW